MIVPPQTRRCEVLIVGAGLAGLATKHWLRALNAATWVRLMILVIPPRRVAVRFMWSKAKSSTVARERIRRSDVRRAGRGAALTGLAAGSR